MTDEQLRSALRFVQQLRDGAKPPAPIPPERWDAYALGYLMQTVETHLDHGEDNPE